MSSGNSGTVATPPSEACVDIISDYSLDFFRETIYNIDMKLH